MIFRRQDYRSDEPFTGRLSKHHDVILHTLLYVSGLVGHIISDVTSSRGRRHRVVHGDPRQVQVSIDGPNLLKVVIELVTIVDRACVDERLQSLILLDGVSPSHLYLLNEGRQLLLYVNLCLFSLFPKTSLLRQLLFQTFHLLIQNTSGLLVLCLLVGQDLIMFSKVVNHPFLGNTLVLELFYTHERLQSETTVS